MVWGEELFFEATKVRANADLDSLRSRSIKAYHTVAESYTGFLYTPISEG